MLKGIALFGFCWMNGTRLGRHLPSAKLQIAAMMKQLDCSVRCLSGALKWISRLPHTSEQRRTCRAMSQPVARFIPAAGPAMADQGASASLVCSHCNKVRLTEWSPRQAVGTSEELSSKKRLFLFCVWCLSNVLPLVASPSVHAQRGWFW